MIKNTAYINIEINYDGKGEFPDISNPEHPIMVIGIMTNEWSKKSFYYGDVDMPDNIPPPLKIEFIKCKSEKDLLLHFMNYWDQIKPTMISGWNTFGFHIPYILNRMKFHDMLIPHGFIGTIPHNDCMARYRDKCGPVDSLTLMDTFAREFHEVIKTQRNGKVHCALCKDMLYENLEDLILIKNLDNKFNLTGTGDNE